VRHQLDQEVQVGVLGAAQYNPAHGGPSRPGTCRPVIADARPGKARTA
jgi:hypothetical protein